MLSFITDNRVDYKQLIFTLSEKTITSSVSSPTVESYAQEWMDLGFVRIFSNGNRSMTNVSRHVT